MAVPSKAEGTLLEKVTGLRNVTGGLVALGVLIAILYYGRVLFITSLAAVIIAFILEPFVGLLVRVRLPRPVASFVVCTAALVCLYLAGMGAYSQAYGLLDELPKYSQKIAQIVDTVKQKMDAVEQKTYQIILPSAIRRRELERQAAEQQAKSKRGRKAAPAPVPPAGTPGAIPEVRIHEEESPISDFIVSRLGSLYQILLMASFVPFLVYFMLSWRDHINRSFLQFFHGEARLVAARSLQGVAVMARAFVVGNFLLGVLLAVVSSAAFWLMRMPYALVVGPLSGFLSLVPYVGLPLALIPPLFVALTALDTLPAFLLVIFVVAIQHLLALNLLYPKLHVAPDPGKNPGSREAKSSHGFSALDDRSRPEHD